MPPTPRSPTPKNSELKNLLEVLKQEIQEDQSERMSKEDIQDRKIEELSGRIEKIVAVPENVTSWRILLTLVQSIAADTIARRMLVGGVLSLIFLLIICVAVLINGHPDLVISLPQK